MSDVTGEAQAGDPPLLDRSSSNHSSNARSVRIVCSKLFRGFAVAEMPPRLIRRATLAFTGGPMPSKEMAPSWRVHAPPSALPGAVSVYASSSGMPTTRQSTNHVFPRAFSICSMRSPSKFSPCNSCHW